MGEADLAAGRVEGRGGQLLDSRLRKVRRGGRQDDGNGARQGEVRGTKRETERGKRGSETGKTGKRTPERVREVKGTENARKCHAKSCGRLAAGPGAPLPCPGADSVRRARRTAPAQKKRRPGGPGRRGGVGTRADYSPAACVRLVPILKNITFGTFAPSIGNSSLISWPSTVHVTGVPTTRASDFQSAGLSVVEPCSV